MRNFNQIEVARTDCFVLGLDAPVRESGNLKGAGLIKIIGPYGEVDLKNSLIVARRHIHMTPADAKRLKLKDKDTVRVFLSSKDRKVILEDTLVRVSAKYALEFHLDTDEANSADWSIVSSRFGSQLAILRIWPNSRIC